MTNQHRGEIVEKVMRRSGYSLTKLSGKLGISRNTLYHRFENPELSYQFIMAVGKVIHYDFNIHFPEMQEQLRLTSKDSISQHVKDQPAVLWRLEGKHAHLLEKYNKLLEIVISVVDANELHEFLPEISKLLEKENK